MTTILHRPLHSIRTLLQGRLEKPGLPQPPAARGAARTHLAPEPRPPLAAGLLAGLAAAKFALHLLTTAVTSYGIHRDELLYLAMGQHLQFWRMDFPPAIAVLANVARALFGDTLFAVRFFPALCGAALVFLAALIARELGGRRFAQAAAATAVLAHPVFLRSASLFQPVVFDQLWWTLGLYALVRLVRTGAPRWWMVLGVAGGFGLLTKVSILFFGFAAAVALLLTPWRRAFGTRWPWLALAVALLIGSPTLVGQVHLGFPIAGQMQALQEAQLERVTPGEFLGMQLLFGPATLLALLGLAALLVGRRLAPFRVIGWTGLTALLMLLVLQGKAYYFAPVYPALFAAGAVCLENIRRVRFAAFWRGAAVALIVVYGLLLLPMGLPLLPPAPMARYAQALGLTEALRTNQGEVGQLPQDYADMLGWEEQVRQLAAVYHSLPPARQRETVIAAENYGEAGAIDFYGPRYGLPGAVSSHTSYWFFGPGDKPGRTLLTIGIPRESLEPLYGTIREAGRHTNPWAVSEEQNLPIYVATDPHQTLQALWPALGDRY